MKREILMTMYILLVAVISTMTALAARVNIYSCGFESAEGFTAGNFFDDNLPSQQGWTGDGAGSYRTVYDGIDNDVAKDDWGGKTGSNFTHIAVYDYGNSPKFDTSGYNEVILTIDLRHTDYGGYYLDGGGFVYLYDSNDAMITRIRFAPNGGPSTPSYGNIEIYTNDSYVDTGVGWSYDGQNDKETLEIMLDQAEKKMTVKYNTITIATNVAWGAGTGTLDQIVIGGGKASAHPTCFDNINVVSVSGPATIWLLVLGLAFIRWKK